MNKLNLPGSLLVVNGRCPKCGELVSYDGSNEAYCAYEDCRWNNPMTPAERQAAYRARKGKQVALILPDDVKAGLDAYLERQRMDGDASTTMSDVIVKLVRAQLLRKR